MQISVRCITAAFLAAFLAALLLLGCSGPDPSQDVESADLVLINGGIYTVDADRSMAEAVAVRGSTIVAVGTNEEIQGLVGESTRVIDLAGRLALPGLHDAHNHPTLGGDLLFGCSLVEQYTQEDILARIAECAAQTDEAWVIGQRWDLAAFPNGSPHKSLLDAIEAERPMYLRGSDGHTAWVNSRALEIARIDVDTPDPDKGVIVRDAETGEPTGTLRETAMQLVEDLIPQPTVESLADMLEAAIQHATGHGITAMIHAKAGEKDWQALRLLDEQGRLNARMIASLVYGPRSKHPPDEWEGVIQRRNQYASERLDTASVKLYLDGVLEGETAALLEPYVGMGEHRGTLNFDPAELVAAVTRFDAMGLQVHMHAIGDRAARVGLDALEAARRANGESDRRHHITHLQLIHPEDIPRFASLGVSANFQALWAYPDRWIMELNLPVVGPGRVDRMYPIGSIERAGGTIVGSSDWPVSMIDPFDAIETAITRQDPSGEVEGILNINEAVSLVTMIEAYTINSARLMGHEEKTGSIEVGKRADIAVVDRDLFEIAPETLSEVRVDMTVLDGEIIYERDRKAGTD